MFRYCTFTPGLDQRAAGCGRHVEEQEFARAVGIEPLHQGGVASNQLGCVQTDPQTGINFLCWFPEERYVNIPGAHANHKHGQGPLNVTYSFIPIQNAKTASSESQGADAGMFL